MASILRSSKFVRYIAGFARNVVLNTPREFDGNLVNTTQCLCGAANRSFASQIPAAQQHEQNLERSLKRIDQDVRKSGRISRRDIEDVLEEIRNTRSATSSQSLLVIRCCGNLVPEEMPETRTKLVQEIWNTLLKLGVPMDVSHYNALLRVYLENEHPFSPTDFLGDLEAKGVEPNRVTYQRLIARYCQVGDIEGATKILEFMREKQLPVNEIVFNALIVGHSQAGDMDSARGIVGVMQQAGLEPSADTYTTLLCGYASKGDLTSINEIFEECDTKEIYLLDKDYLDIIYALAINGHGEHVPLILHNKVRKAIGYNQDAINLILRLINKGRETIAFLLLESMPRQTRPDGTIMPTGFFFIKHLVKANRPVEKIVEICDQLESKNMYDRGLLLATETSLQLGNETLAYPLLTELHQRNIEIRQHYFWPLIVSKANDTTGQGIVDVLMEMNRFNITPNNETLRDYVIPNIKGKSSEIIARLRDANVSLGASAANLVHSLLLRNEMTEAAIITGRVTAYYNPEVMRRPLSNAFYRTHDLDSYITIVRNIYDNLDRRSTTLRTTTNTTSDANIENDMPTTSQQQIDLDKSEIIGNLIYDLSTNHQEFPDIICNVLQRLHDQGLSISTISAEKIQDKLGEKITDEISNLLGKLTSGELTPVPIAKKQPSYTPSHQMSIPQLERLVQNLDAKNQPTKGYKRQLFNLYYRAKDLDKTEKLLTELDDDFIFTSGFYAQLLDLYAYHDNLEKALYYLDKLKSLYAAENTTNLTLDETKIVRLAYLLVKSDKLDDALALLNDTARERSHQGERNFSYLGLVWRFLNSLADTGRVDDLSTIFDILVRKDYIEVNNILLGPLIKVHLVNNDLDKAVEKFEWAVNQFKATPWKNELTCKLIQAEDAEKLQKLTDLSTQVHGEINSLYDLVFAFVECGRIRQARRILETPGLQSRPQRINTACERYQQEGSVKSLEGLKDATKDLNHIDRSDIYYQLLLTYINQEDVDKALGLWTQMQEEDMLPNDQFLVKLGDFLEKSGVEVPFVKPTITTTNKDIIDNNISTSTNLTSNRAISPVQLFRQKLKSGDLDGALKVLNRNSTKSLTNDHRSSFSIVDYSLLLEKLIQTDRLTDAKQLTVSLLDRNLCPVNRVLKFLLNRLAAQGDVDALDIIGSKITQDVKKNVSFDNRICHANLVAGRADEYLTKLELELDNCGTDDVNLIGEKFPRGGAYGILERHPELLEKYENIAIKYVKRGIVAPVNVLWTNHFVSGNDDKAEQLWNDYLKDAPRIMFQRIVQTARDNKDESLIRKLIEHLKISNVTAGAIGNAYSCLLDVLVIKEERNDEMIIETFEKALQDVDISFINRTAILRVREIYGKAGKLFNYQIPAKVLVGVGGSNSGTAATVAATTSSSSSSDEDVKK